MGQVLNGHNELVSNGGGSGDGGLHKFEREAGGRGWGWRSRELLPGLEFEPASGLSIWSPASFPPGTMLYNEVLTIGPHHPAVLSLVWENDGVAVMTCVNIKDCNRSMGSQNRHANIRLCENNVDQVAGT